MNLTYEQIASITQGVAYMEQKDEGIQFHRFTSAQEKGYDGSDYHPKQYATAGVRLHFKTDSKSLYMKVLTSMRRCSRIYICIRMMRDSSIIQKMLRRR